MIRPPIASHRSAPAGFAAAFLILGLQLTTKAQVRIAAEEVGADVVFTISGTFSPTLAGIDSTSSAGPVDGISAAEGSFWFSPNQEEVFDTNRFSITGPSSYGLGPRFTNTANLSLSAGVEILLSANVNQLSFDRSYAGGPIDGTMTYAGESFDSLGIDRAGGPYVWDAGGGQTITLEFPESASFQLIRPVAELVPGEAPEGGDFGRAVAIYGDTAAVGHPWYGSPPHGAVRVFQRNASETADSWAETAVVSHPTSQGGAEFGAAAALSNSILVVGARADDVLVPPQDLVSNAGAVYVFQRQLSGVGSPALEWVSVAKLTAPFATQDAAFGWSVSVSADRIAVGERHGSGGVGQVYLYERNDDGADAWGHIATIMPPPEAIGFGTSVSLCGDRLLVGAPWTETSSGRAYIYERNQDGGEVWGLVATLAEEPQSGQEGSDSFGYSVALHGDAAIVGIPSDNENGVNNGAAQVHERNTGDIDSWGKVVKLLAPDSDGAAGFGASVSLWNDYAVVGAPFAQHEASPETWEPWGAAHVYHRNQDGPDSWDWLRDMRPLAGDPSWEYGMAVGTWNGQFVIGASGAEERGKAFLRAFRYRNRFTKVAELPNSHPGGFFFGRSLRLFNDTLVIASGPETTGSDIFIHERNHGGEEAWGEVAELSVPDALDGLDETIAYYGDFVAAGNREAEVDGRPHSGKIHLFERNAEGIDKWSPIQSIDEPAQQLGALGQTFDIHHRFLFAPTKATNILPSWLYCYERNEGGAENWNWIGESPAEERDDPQPRPVTIHGDLAVAGTPHFSALYLQQGRVSVYQRNDGVGLADSWALSQNIIPSDVGDIGGARFGHAVSLSGDTAKGATLAVGAPGAVTPGGSGGVYLYQRYEPTASGAHLTWGEITKIPPPEPPFGAGTVEGFGTHVRLSDSMLAATGRWSSLQPDSWWVFIFERNEDGADEWGLIDQLRIGPVSGGAGDVPVGMDLYGETLVFGICGWEGKGKVEVWRRGIQTIAELDLFPQGNPKPEYRSNGVSLQWFALGGIAYTVEYSDTLEANDWKVLPGYENVLGQDALTTALDQKVEGQDVRFYRLVLRIAPVPASQ